MSSSKSIKNKNIFSFNKLFYIFCVCFFIVIQSVSFFVKNDENFSNLERRNLSSLKKIDFDLFDTNFIINIENALKDQYFLRNNFLSIKSKINSYLNINYINGVYILDDKFIEEEVEVNYDVIASKTSNLLKNMNDIKANVFLFMFPNSYSVYNEDLPIWSKKSYQDEIFDLLINTYEKSLIHFVDVRPLLNEIKDEKNNLYYNTDHHLSSDTMFLLKNKFFEILNIEDNYLYHKVKLNDNFKGSLTAKSGIFNDLKDDLNIYVNEENIHYIVTNYDKNTKATSIFDFDKINSYDPYLCFVGDNASLINIKTEFYNKNRLLVVKDSFANCFIPYLIPFYSEIDIVDPRYMVKDFIDTISLDEYDEVILFHNLNTYIAN